MKIHEQFGDEWQKEMMKFRKDQLVNLLRTAWKTNLELEKNNSIFDTTMDKLGDSFDGVSR